METVSKNLQKKIMEVMMDKESRDIPKIKEDLKRDKNFIYGRDYGEGHLAGVLRVLASNGNLEKVERGVYRVKQTSRSVLVERPTTKVVIHRNALEQNDRTLVSSEEISLEQIRQEALVSLETQYRTLVSRMDAIAMSSLAPGDIESVKQLSELKEELKRILVRHNCEN